MFSACPRLRNRKASLRSIAAFAAVPSRETLQLMKRHLLQRRGTRLGLHARVREREASLRRGKRQSGRKQHAVGDLARELEHLRAGRSDIDRILPALGERHLGAAQLVQLAVLGHRLAAPQRAQCLDILPHDPDRLARPDAGLAEIEDVADRHGQDHAPLRDLGQCRDRHRDRQRRPQVGTDRGRHERGALRHAGCRGRPDHGVAVAHVLGEPEARMRRPAPPRGRLRASRPSTKTHRRIRRPASNLLISTAARGWCGSAAAT